MRSNDKLSSISASKHPINPILRVAIPLLRWPFILYPALFALTGIGSARYAAPLQKQFYLPILEGLWAILALLPFIVIRRRTAYFFYCAVFCIVAGWLLYDLFVPFRYVAPDFRGQIEDAGGSYTMSVTDEKCFYWITRFVPSNIESWISPAFLIWPFLLGSCYHFAYVRGQRNAA